MSEDFWIPAPGAQTNFLSCPAFECLYGGAAAGGKTDCLLMEALRQIEHPEYNGVLFRRTYAQLGDANGLIARSLRYFPSYKGEYNKSDHIWTFPSGAHIFFRHLATDADLENYRGPEYAYMAFDELSQFERSQYVFLLGRCRVKKGSGLRAYARATANPGSEWVKQRFVTQGIVNRIGYFKNIKDVDTRVPKGTPESKSRCFIPATYRDNPFVDPEYIATMNQYDEVLRAQLLDGDWDVEDREGRVYPDFSSIYNVDADIEYDPNYPIWWAIDDGYVEGEGRGSASYHPRVVLIAQQDGRGGVKILDEDYQTGESDYDKTIQRVLDKGYPPPDKTVIDSSAAMFRGALFQRGFSSIPGTHVVHEGIRNVRRMIKDGNDQRLIKVHPRCQELIWEMGHYKQEKGRYADAGEMKVDKRNDHGPDALRYLCWRIRYAT